MSAATPSLETIARNVSPEEIQSLAQQFLREGYVVIPTVLSRETCAELKEEVDGIYRNVPCDAPEQGYGDWLRVKLFHYSQRFAQLIDHAPVIDVVEAILGNTCHLIANNFVRNDKDFSISAWHVDDELLFPLPDGVEFDERIELPCFILNTQWYLTDVGPDDGPTEVVPFSHRAGHHPPHCAPGAQPSYKNHPAKSLLVNAGDVALQHAQVWHRGAPVRSNNTRYLLQYAYGKRCVAQRFFPFIGYTLPEHVKANASERRLRLLGHHPRGPYG